MGTQNNDNVTKFIQRFKILNVFNQKIINCIDNITDNTFQLPLNKRIEKKNCLIKNKK